MSGSKDWKDDPRWLEMPGHRRAIALKRMESLLEYESLKPPSQLDRERIAASMKVGRARFFHLLKTWRLTESPVELAPYASPVRQTRSTMDARRAERLEALCREVTAGSTDRTIATLTERIQGDWDPRLGAVPARATIRRYLAEASRAFLPMAGLLDGGVRASTSLPTFKSDRTEVAWAFGDTLVVDHMAADLWVVANGAARRPLVTLAIDLFTGTAVGAVLHADAASPVAVEAALRDAARRSSGSGGKARRPRISLSATFAAEWDDLVSRLVGAGLAVSIARSSKLQHGAPGKRLLHGRLGRLKLLARKGHLADGGVAEHDPARHSILTIEEARRVLEVNMECHIEEIGGVSPLAIDL